MLLTWKTGSGADDVIPANDSSEVPRTETHQRETESVTATTPVDTQLGSGEVCDGGEVAQLMEVGNLTENLDETVQEEETQRDTTDERVSEGGAAKKKRKKSKNVTQKGRNNKKTKGAAGTRKGRGASQSVVQDNGEAVDGCGYDHKDLDSYKTEDDPRYWTSGGEFHRVKCLNDKCRDAVRAKNGMGFRRCKGYSTCGLVWCSKMQCFESNKTVAEVMAGLQSVNGNGRTSRRAGRKHWHNN